MATTKQLRAALLPIFAMATMAATVGCSTLQSRPAEPIATEADTVSVTDPVVVVELRDGDEKREYLRAPLTESMLVQDALNGSGATHRFRRMDVVLVRHVPGGRKLRLPVHYNSSTKRVVNEHNYSLHSGDWLEVTQDTSTMVDRMLEQALEPLRPVMRTYRD